MRLDEDEGDVVWHLMRWVAIAVMVAAVVVFLATHGAEGCGATVTT